MVHEVCCGSGGVGAGRSAKSLGLEKEETWETWYEISMFCLEPKRG
jgi:hypothetical protein